MTRILDSLSIKYFPCLCLYIYLSNVIFIKVIILKEENFEFKLPQDEAPQDGGNDETSQ